MNRDWLGRLAFSFLIIGFFLAWQGYRAATGELGNIPQSKIILYLAGATCAFVMGFLGIRARHRGQ